MYYISKTVTTSEFELEELRKQIFSVPHCMVHLIGELGAGKTTLLKMILGDFVDSPSFALHNEYIFEYCQRIWRVSHWDFYRASRVPEEFFFDDNDVIFVEWADKFADVYFHKAADLIIYLTLNHKVFVFSLSTAS